MGSAFRSPDDNWLTTFDQLKDITDLPHHAIRTASLDKTAFDFLVFMPQAPN